MNKEFLKVAEDLYKIGLTHKGKKREFYFRSSISRAYYGVLWYIRDFYDLKGTDLHGMARAVLSTKNQELKALIDILGRGRNYADYYKKSPIKFDEKVTKTYIEIAKRIVMRLKH